MDGQNIIVTGAPGVGKTTVIKGVAELMKSSRPSGFYTEEIRDKGVRKGFELVDMQGDRQVLSHVKLRVSDKVGKYGVDVAGFEAFLDKLNLSDQNAGPVLIDEIGKMECLSDKFKELVKDLLDSPRTVIAAVALHGAGFIESVKRRDDIELIEITPRNRDLIPARIVSLLKEE